MTLILEFKDYLIRCRSFLAVWVMRIFILSLVYSYAMKKFEEFLNHNYLYSVPGYVNLLGILQVPLLFLSLYFFREKLDDKNRVGGKDFFLFLLRIFLVALLLVLILGIAFLAVGAILQTSKEMVQSPGIQMKYALLAGTVFAIPAMILYSSISFARVKVLPSWSDYRFAALNQNYRLGTLALILLTAFGHIFPVAYCGFPDIEDGDSYYKFAIISLNSQFFLLFITELIHLYLLFSFVKEIGGVTLQEE
ncbi:hypothetical protein EHQ53_09690 [Leptospira langatensis]|uniref:Uncharacterized protein n=1 Tax=Leptospira langatensis TaxID=2484983 RepID=A0A5F1ZT38_9LEPT|nr:hypothetical protein [Leptospira langatensis]TGK00291.1 hypothetical protein EHO57_13500 [Leptospira langatensis]TGL41073.1 hypothetical protein EHQ53_09690 [Leptospira langatensis]